MFEPKLLPPVPPELLEGVVCQKYLLGRRAADIVPLPGSQADVTELELAATGHVVTTAVLFDEELAAGTSSPSVFLHVVLQRTVFLRPALPRVAGRLALDAKF